MRVCICLNIHMYQCIRINPTESAKNVRTKCILRAKYVYRGWDLAELLRVSDCLFRSRNSPWFDPSILRHSGIWRAADEAVLNKKNSKNLPFCLNMCIDVSLYRPLNKCLYWRIYVCMYRLEYMYQCIRISPTVIGKKFYSKLTVLGSIPASSDTVEPEGRQRKQCWIKYILKNPKNLLVR